MGRQASPPTHLPFTHGGNTPKEDGMHSPGLRIGASGAMSLLGYGFGEGQPGVCVSIGWARMAPGHVRSASTTSGGGVGCLSPLCSLLDMLEPGVSLVKSRTITTPGFGDTPSTTSVHRITTTATNENNKKTFFFSFWERPTRMLVAFSPVGPVTALGSFGSCTGIGLVCNQLLGQDRRN